MRARRILNKPLKGWKAQGHTIYRNIESALLKAGLPANTWTTVMLLAKRFDGFERKVKRGIEITAVP